jgi:hypothetical protein
VQQPGPRNTAKKAVHQQGAAATAQGAWKTHESYILRKTTDDSLLR